MKAAFFDFDATLTTKDTLLPWLIALHGRKKTLRVLASVLLNVGRDMPADLLLKRLQARNIVKEKLFERLVKGVPVGDALAAGLEMGRKIIWKEDIVKEIARHQTQGHCVVIATGAQTLYIEPLVRERFGVLHVIGTDLEEKNGILTGLMIHGNCVRVRKKERVQAWIEKNGPFDEIWGYGNAPHDLPMLQLCNHARVI